MSHTKQYELIIERAKDLQIIQMEEDLLSIMMDLESADETFHVRWDDLLAADDFNFVHDVCGIRNHIVRDDFPSHGFGYFVHESERTQLLKKIREDYIIVEESKVTPSKKKNSKKLLQFIEIEKRV